MSVLMSCCEFQKGIILNFKVIEKTHYLKLSVWILMSYRKAQ